jgi:hypothetical protein
MNMKLVPLGGKLGAGKFAKVDDEQYQKVMIKKWIVDKKGYVRSTEQIGWLNGKQKNRSILLHRFVYGARPGLNLDHQNGNKFDCRRENLRPASYSENNVNRRKQQGCTSRYKGVYWDKQRRKWHVRIGWSGKTLYIGHFDEERYAGMAYDIAALDIHGRFAKLNFNYLN